MQDYKPLLQSDEFNCDNPTAYNIEIFLLLFFMQLMDSATKRKRKKKCVSKKHNPGCCIIQAIITVSDSLYLASYLSSCNIRSSLRMICIVTTMILHLPLPAGALYPARFRTANGMQPLDEPWGGR
jgi:hypothetical protein